MAGLALRALFPSISTPSTHRSMFGDTNKPVLTLWTGAGTCSTGQFELNPTNKMT